MEFTLFSGITFFSKLDSRWTTSTIYIPRLLLAVPFLSPPFSKNIKGEEKSLSALNRGGNYFRIIDE